MNPHDIKALLGKNGVTQLKLASDLGVHHSLIGRVIFRQSKSRRVSSHIAEAVGQPFEKLWPEFSRATRRAAR